MISEKRSQAITLEIFKIILEEQNGLTPEEIETHKLAVKYPSSALFIRIKEVIRNS
jgi:hypothetical protein